MNKVQERMVLEYKKCSDKLRHMEKKIIGYDTVIFRLHKDKVDLYWIASGLLTNDEIARYCYGLDEFNVVFLKRHSKRHEAFKKWYRDSIYTVTYKSL
jgi:hypothetical protein